MNNKKISLPRTPAAWLEAVMNFIFFLCGILAVGCVLLISVYMVISGVPAIQKIGLFRFLFGTRWASTAADPAYGILPFILSSVYGTLSAIVVLAVMILPSIVSVSVTALNAVPPEYEQGSLALGATDAETWFKVSVPAARSGIAAGIVLGIGRAIGEAMAVMMVAGNSPNMPDSLFRSVTFLTTAIAKEMSYASGLQKQALFSIALVLFVFIMGINILLNVVLKGGKRDE